MGLKHVRFSQFASDADKDESLTSKIERVSNDETVNRI